MLKLGVHKTFKGKRLYEEVWKDVVGYEGLYKVSNLGRVRSLDKEIIITGVQKHPVKGIKKGKIFNPSQNPQGYYSTTLHKDKKIKLVRVHRLVAMAFIPNPENKPYIDHINTIKTDNRVQNLRWVTQKENCNNELTRKHNSESKIGKKYSEERKMNMRENSSLKMRVMCVETGIIYKSAMEAGRQTGIPQGNISSACRGERGKAGGYRWKLV